MVLLLDLDPDLLAPSTYPSTGDILSSVALTFFAYLGFNVIAFSAGDMENPSRDLPRAMFISLGATMVIYVALAIGVFGTLTVDEVIAEGDTALAAAAQAESRRSRLHSNAVGGVILDGFRDKCQRLRWRGLHGEPGADDASFRPSSRDKLGPHGVLRPPDLRRPRNCTCRSSST